MRRKQDKPMKTSTKVLALLGIGLGAFIIAMVVTFWAKGAVPDTLIDKVLDVGKWEAGFLALIKVANIFKGEREDT